MENNIDRRDAMKVMGAAAGAAYLPFGITTNKKETDYNQDKSAEPSYAENFSKCRSKEQAIGVLLENQRKHNPELVPQMRSILENTYFWDWVSVQPALSLDYEGFAYRTTMVDDKTGKPVTMDDVKDNQYEGITLLLDSVMVPIDKTCKADVCSIEKMIVDTITDAVQINTNWDFNTALGDTIKERYEHLYVEFVKTSTLIHQKTLCGGGNVIITSPEISSIFETTTTRCFEPTPSEEYLKRFNLDVVGSEYGTFGNKFKTYKAGVMNNRWRLYKSPQAQKNLALVMYKSDAVTSNGCVFMPLYLEDKNTLRYGIKITNPNYFALLELENYIL